MDTSQINADNFPIGKDQTIKLLSASDIKKLPKGSELFSVGGKKVIIGKDTLDLETTVFKRSKYGQLIDPKPISKKKNK